MGGRGKEYTWRLIEEELLTWSFCLFTDVRLMLRSEQRLQAEVSKANLQTSGQIHFKTSLLRTQAADADPSPLKLNQKAKSTISAKLP